MAHPWPNQPEPLPLAIPCEICGTPRDNDAADLCSPCVDLLRWVRGYFAHEPGLAEKITPKTRFVEDLMFDSLDWMIWPLEAEEKLGISIRDVRELERIKTIGDWIRILRLAGAQWPANHGVRLLPRRWWQGCRWVATAPESDPFRSPQ